MQLPPLMAPGGEPEPAERPNLLSRTVAGFVVLFAAILFFLLDAFVPGVDLKAPAWGFLAFAGYFFFGLKVADVLGSLIDGIAATRARSREDRDGDG